MLDKIKNLFKKSEAPKVASDTTPVKKSRKPKEKKNETALTEKEKATQAGEPYINILSMDIDPNDINSGSFDLDFNDKFVLNLVRAGYKFKDTDTDNDIVDRWFQTICRNVALEVYEQTQADPSNRDMRTIKQRDLGNGRTEVS